MYLVIGYVIFTFPPNMEQKAVSIMATKTQVSMISFLKSINLC